MHGPARRRLHVVPLAVGAVVVGGAVGLLAQWYAGRTCPPGTPPGLLSSCDELIAGLAWRIGAAAGVAVLLMGAIAAGLARTAEELDDERRIREEEEEAENRPRAVGAR